MYLFYFGHFLVLLGIIFVAIIKDALPIEDEPPSVPSVLVRHPFHRTFVQPSLVQHILRQDGPGNGCHGQQFSHVPHLHIVLQGQERLRLVAQQKHGPLAPSELLDGAGAGGHVGHLLRNLQQGSAAFFPGKMQILRFLPKGRLFVLDGEEAGGEALGEIRALVEVRAQPVESREEGFANFLVYLNLCVRMRAKIFFRILK
mmetsp:Transcript_4099/g.7911  ORF Transcript_4099/g.7911 Transcript_4099/m.7911 type:complete len:201 (+) Transcript_4099:1277-1879(+)